MTPPPSVEKTKRYEKISFLGEGQFATVYKAKDFETGLVVAIKKIKLGTKADVQDGINRTAVREIKFLQELSHPNVIGLLDTFGHKSNISLVFDFMETDLEAIVRDTQIVLTPAHVKAYMIMTLQGLEYLHNCWILHRDLKPNNLLINSEGVLKIGDFGLARYFGSPNKCYSNQVVTRWYRAPELLFGAKIYGTGIDIWAVGCILAELLLRAPFLPGESDLEQLTKIFQTLGTPTEEDWPHIDKLPHFVQFKPSPSIPFQDIFTAAGDDLLKILNDMLALNPLKRKQCSDLLMSPYFSNPPGPTPCSELPLPSNVTPMEEVGPSTATKRKYSELDSSNLVKKLAF